MYRAREGENVDGMFSRWTGVSEWGKGKSVASLFVGLTGVRRGKMMVSAYRIYARREGGTKTVAKGLLGLTSAYANRKVEENNVAQLEKCKVN